MSWDFCTEPSTFQKLFIRQVFMVSVHVIYEYWQTPEDSFANIHVSESILCLLSVDNWNRALKSRDLRDLDRGHRDTSGDTFGYLGFIFWCMPFL